MAGESALALSAPSLSVNESGTRQLSANLLFDDDTATPLDANTIVWSVASGPLSGIDAAGLITTETVYQNSAAAVQGIYRIHKSEATRAYQILVGDFRLKKKKKKKQRRRIEEIKRENKSRYKSKKM